ncbi:hypothetical protein L2E82_45168 [Cichorium intybus]|uniref:Uncharacterized protein n=1 Tax=Cichorium intybus TaxID=13427 RepID=A0ACB8ZR98_CICIN|nr:hypothetical protein L2E82_45168 [Cichorium intybus]
MASPLMLSTATTNHQIYDLASIYLSRLFNEVAARLFNNAEAKCPKFENGGGGYDSNDNKDFSSDLGQKPVYNHSVASSYGYGNPTKKIDIPNGRVGVIIGKAGETIKYLQLQSGAKIQVTRDTDADPHSVTRQVELSGFAESMVNFVA